MTAEIQQPAMQEKPITKERRAEMLAAFSAKYGLDGLDVFVRKDKDYDGDGRAYDLLIKNGRTAEFQARVFTLAESEWFTETALQNGLAALEQSDAFQQFFSFRQGQRTLFDQPEDEKVDSVEPAQTAKTEPESTIEFGLLGNGITVYDTARTQPHSSDDLIVAHISEEGNVQYYAEISDSDRMRVEAEAARQLAKFTEQWNALPDTKKLMRMMQTANPTQLVQIIDGRLPADQTIAKYEKSVIFHSEDFPADEQKQAAAVSEPLTVETLKKRCLNRDTNRQMDSYEIAGMVLLDSEDMTVSAQEFFDRYHASRYSPTQAAEIRGYIAEALENSPAAAEEADNRPKSDMTAFVQEQNRRVLDGLAVGDQIGIGGKSWEVEKINGDFMLTLRNPDAESSEAGRQIIGDWNRRSPLCSMSNRSRHRLWGKHWKIV